MKLYNAAAPNPRRVRILHPLVARRDLALQAEFLEGATRTDAFRMINSLGELPVLELDDGTNLTESVAICRYLEALHPEPPLFGREPKEIGLVEMWNRRVEITVFQPVGNVALHTFEFFKDKIDQIPAYADTQRNAAQQRYTWLDRELSDGRQWLAGDYFSVADITMMMVSMVAGFTGQPFPDGLKHLKSYENRLQARPSWNA